MAAPVDKGRIFLAERNEATRRQSSSVVATKATPSVTVAGAEAFYRDTLNELLRSGVPFLVAGGFALAAYTGITRETKDLDVFCKAGDYPRVLAHFKRCGYAISVEDELWIGKVCRGVHYLDVIFAAPSGSAPVTDEWISNARQAEVLGVLAPIIGPTELVWSKCFIQQHDRFDGADVAHLILKAHEDIDWHRLLSRMEAHWEVLLSHLIMFRWIYPSERDAVPAWLMHELLDRLRVQLEMPPSKRRVCRGGLLARSDYSIDVKEWGFVDFNGKGGPSDAA
ncbi:MAG TPA: hypothetical protein VF226_07755 [Hyphomicrobiaceae bacterium]